MCGRYALGVRMAFIRRRMQEQGMAVDEAPDDDDIRETYNFAPGNIGAVYRADIPAPDIEAHQHHQLQQREVEEEDERRNVDDEKERKEKVTGAPVHYKLQGMKWGLIPFWTKRQPDYGSLMRTINCRDDSLVDDRGMWTSMKRRKRCIVVCQGYYEWLKRGAGGKERIPYFTRRKDGDLMYLAGLWDYVSYEGSEERLYTYTVITTSAHSSLQFLHDRMPVILDPNSAALKTWLDPHRTQWSKELQAILKPYEGELECYQVPKEVGKVGNNSPDFIVPVSSKENKSNIANFFANAKQKVESATDIGHEDQGDDITSPPATKRRHLENPDAMNDGDTKKRKTQASPISSPQKTQESNPSKVRSATHNQKLVKKTAGKKLTGGTPRITKFFSK